MSDKNINPNQLKDKKTVREFKLSSLAIDSGTSVFVMIFMLILLGTMAYTSMPRESYPEIKIPMIYVGTPYPGNSPLDMENLVTRPIEKELNSITGVTKITSNSIQDYSTIVVEFGFDVDVKDALQEVKDAVDRASPELPTDLPAEPNAFEMSFSEMPIVNINLAGYENLDELNKYAEYLQDEVEQFSEIKEVNIRGVQDKEVSINVDVYELEARNLGFGDIEGAIGAENITLSGGDILAQNLRRNIRIVGEFKNLAEIENIIVSNEEGRMVYLKDVAKVKFGYEDTESYAREYGESIVTLDVIKRSGENLLDAVDKIKALIVASHENGSLPQQLKVTYSNDQSKMTRLMVENLENSIIAGVILVVLVLLFFMGFRNALFVGVAIPLSMLIGFLVLQFWGATLNMMVLFSLILALGLLVDNGIVVVENIYRLMSEGLPPIQAAKEGVGEVALPIISSTATTLAAFVPLLFWDDIMGEFMGYLPMTLIIVLTSSLFVGLVINPVLTSRFMKLEDENEKTNYKKLGMWTVGLMAAAAFFYASESILMGSLSVVAAGLLLLNVFVLTPLSNRFQKHAMPAMERVYQKFVGFALRGFKPFIFFIGAFALLVFSIVLMGNAGLKTLLFPEGEPNYINIFIEHPIGTDIEKANSFAGEVEAQTIEMMKPYDYMVESILTKVGSGTSDPNTGMPDMGNTPNKSRITVSFIESQNRKGVNTIKLMESLREMTRQFAGVSITLGKDANGPPPQPPVNLEISGEDFDRLVEIAVDVKQFMEDKNVAGVEGLKMNLETGKPELLVTVNREKARRFGLSTAQVATTIRTAIFGKEISKFKEGEEDYPIQLRFSEEIRYDLGAILNQKITFRNNQGKLLKVPIKAVADIEYSSTVGSVNRKDLDRVITVFSNVNEGYNGTEIVAQYRNFLADYDLPTGYTFEFTGEQEEMEETSEFLGKALMIAVLSIFLILVMQFNSVALPFVVIISVIFSTMGVFMGYAFYKMDFIIIMTGIGIISLAGIVVNNAIVLIDYINLIRDRKRQELDVPKNKSLTKKEIIGCIIQAGTKRLRPVLLTAITTVLGLMPLATGMNINFYTLLTELDPQFYTGGDNAIFWGAMAWAVIFGLVFATFLTLIVVPIMYLGVERVSAWILDDGIYTDEDISKPQEPTTMMGIPDLAIE